MTFQVIPALIAGLVATVIMTAMMQAAAKMGLTEMPPMTLVTGSMMSNQPERARNLGVMIHYIVMGTVVFGLIYAGLFTAFDSASWLTGGLLGAAHGVLVGAMALPMMSSIHPRMKATVPTGSEAGAGVALDPPGFFGVRWGAMTPVGLIIGHIIYGIVAALVYAALI